MLRSTDLNTFVMTNTFYRDNLSIDGVWLSSAMFSGIEKKFNPSYTTKNESSSQLLMASTSSNVLPRYSMSV